MSGLIKQRTRKRQFGKKVQVKNMEKDDIKKLVLQAAQGNKAAFGALYEETGRTVYFSCLKLLGDQQLAEDITQETYLTALQKLGTLAQPENFPAWVNRIGINLCKMHFRNNSAPEDNSEEIIEDIPDEGLIPEEYVSNDAKRKIIMDIIDTVLTEEQRQSVILYYFDMLTVPEIAEVMNCTTGTVTSRLSAARKKIKEAVLIYEENNNDRLHAAVPVFILSKLLMKEASTTALPKLTVFTSTAANAVPDKVTSTKTKSGGKGMFSTVKAKVIAGVCAAAVVGGGITAAVMLSSNNSDDDDNNDIVVASSQNDSTASKGDEDVSDTANDNKDSDLYWIDSFQGGTPSASLDPNIFGSEITLPIDLSQISGGNGSVLYYGDEICKSKDIYSLSNMLSENYDLDLEILADDENQTGYDIHSINPFERDASYGEVLSTAQWSVAIPFDSVIDTTGWEQGLEYGEYVNKNDIGKIVETLGTPTSIYTNSEYDDWTSGKFYIMYWENEDYTVSFQVNEMYLSSEDVTLYYFYGLDFMYYSKNYPQEQIHENDGEALFTSEYTGIAKPGESAADNKAPVYEDLKTLDLKSDAVTPTEVTVNYDGTEATITAADNITTIREKMGRDSDSDYQDSLDYGITASSIGYILDFRCWMAEGNPIREVAMYFSTENNSSIFGISKNSTIEEIVSILGTPEVSDLKHSGGTADQYLYWKTPCDGGTLEITAYYCDGKLQSITADFDNI